MSKERMGLFKRFRNVIFERETTGKEAGDSPDTSEENSPESEHDESVDQSAENQEEVAAQQEEKSQTQEEISNSEDGESDIIKEDEEKSDSNEMSWKIGEDAESEDTLLKEDEEESQSENQEEVEASDEDPLEVQFAIRFGELGGRFVYCESLDELKASLGSLMEDKAWDRVFLWEDEVKTLVANNKYQRNPLGFNMEKSDVAISYCEKLVADDGSILLSPYQASQRGLQVFPDHQVVLAKPSQVVPSIADALVGFKEKYRDQLPSRLSLEPNAKNLTVEGTLILNCGGTKDVYVFLCEEL